MTESMVFSVKHFVHCTWFTLKSHGGHHSHHALMICLDHVCTWAKTFLKSHDSFWKKKKCPGFVPSELCWQHVCLFGSCNIKNQTFQKQQWQMATQQQPIIFKSIFHTSNLKLKFAFASDPPSFQSQEHIWTQFQHLWFQLCRMLKHQNNLHEWAIHILRPSMRMLLVVKTNNKIIVIALWGDCMFDLCSCCKFCFSFASLHLTDMQCNQKSGILLLLCFSLSKQKTSHEEKATWWIHIVKNLDNIVATLLWLISANWSSMLINAQTNNWQLKKIALVLKFLFGTCTDHSCGYHSC